MARGSTDKDVMSHHERIGKLFLLFLNHPRGLSFADVRSHLSEAYRGNEEASRKKFQRDREALKKLGLHLQIDQAGAAANPEDSVYVPAPTARTLLKELKLSDEQRSYLMGLILRHMNECEKGSSKHELCRSLYIKLFYNQTDRAPSSTGADVKADPLLWTDRPAPDSVLRILQEAMINRNKVEIVYEGAKETKRRLVQPLALNIYRRIWYLTAYCELVSDYRIFQLDRISSAEIKIASIDSHPAENIQFLKPHPLNLRREPLQPIQLLLHADHLERFDFFIRELPPGQRKRSGQRMRDIVTSNPEALFFWMFRHPHAVQAIAPKAVRDRFIAFLKSIEERNGGEA